MPLRTGSSSQHSQHLGQHTCASVYGQRSPELFATIFLHLCVNAASLSSRASAVTNSEKVKNVNLGCGRCETDARSLRHPVLGFRGPGYTESAALGYSSHKRHSRSTRKKFTNLLSIVGTFYARRPGITSCTGSQGAGRGQHPVTTRAISKSRTLQRAAKCAPGEPNTYLVFQGSFD